jgi:hypothetical protein
MDKIPDRSAMPGDDEVKGRFVARGCCLRPAQQEPLG